MRSIVTPDEMRQIEQKAVDSGTSVEALMEQAGLSTAKVIVDLVEAKALAKSAFIVCGNGNNGGDGYVVARHLLSSGFSVSVFQYGVTDPSSLAKKQRRRYEARGGRVVDKLLMPKDGVLVDALFGTGFHGRQKEETIEIIRTINQAKIPIISVDVPSGLNVADGSVEDIAVFATITCCMECPKVGFFLDEGWNHVGDVHTLEIGLKNAVQDFSPKLSLLEREDVAHLMPKVVRNRNKYTSGHVVGLAGSHGMAGSALMASFAALRTGAGIVHLLHPEEYSLEFTGQPLEIVRIAYTADDIEAVKNWIERSTALFLGPGLGQGERQSRLLEAIWPLLNDKKLVLDADGLTWLAKTKRDAFGPLPDAILTPHLGELLRFFEQKEKITFDFLEKVKDFVDKNQTNLILKGGPTFLFSHGKTPLVVMQGDPGMATAGSGDVLTGILAALLSQGLSAQDAMLLGSYLHGVAGEVSARDETSYSMTATSIIAKLPAAIRLTTSQNLPILA